MATGRFTIMFFNPFEENVNASTTMNTYIDDMVLFPDIGLNFFATYV